MAIVCYSYRPCCGDGGGEAGAQGALAGCGGILAPSQEPASARDCRTDSNSRARGSGRKTRGHDALGPLPGASGGWSSAALPCAAGRRGEAGAQGALGRLRRDCTARLQAPPALDVDTEGMRARKLAVLPARVLPDGGGEAGAQGAVDGCGGTARDRRQPASAFRLPDVDQHRPRAAGRRMRSWSARRVQRVWWDCRLGVNSPPRSAARSRGAAPPARVPRDGGGAGGAQGALAWRRHCLDFVATAAASSSRLRMWTRPADAAAGRRRRSRSARREDGCGGNSRARSQPVTAFRGQPCASAWRAQKLGAVLLVLLIAVANVANLLLARAAARWREMAVRAAIGAAKTRLARQALTESLALGVVGGAGGMLFAAGLLRVFRGLAPAGIARLDEAVVDWRIAGFSLFATIAASMLFGLAPAMRSPSPETLTGGRVARRRREWLRPSLVALQIALSLILLCGAALLMQSLRNMANTPLGMETSSLLSAYAQLPGARYPQPAQSAAFWKSLAERLTALPGVEAIGIADSLPPQGRAQGRIFSSIHVDGRPRHEGRPTGRMVTVREVSASYFPMLRIPVRKGRLFVEGEKQAIVLSERMAARMFPGETALGRHVVLSGEATLEVTGIVGDVRNGGLTTSSDPEIYLLSNRERPRQYVLLRADTRVIPFVREAFRELDPRLTIQFETLDERVRNMRARPRFQSMLLGGFAVAGLVLAAVGLYGVTALFTAQRTGEIGVRIALGATTGDIRAMVLRQAGWWTVAGVVIGLCGAAACARLIEGLLYGVKATAPLPLAVAVLWLTLASLGAAWLPARRASLVSPVEALREL
jgi:predicted permease